MYVCIDVCMYVSLNVYMCVCVCVYIYIYIYIYICVCVCINKLCIMTDYITYFQTVNKPS